MMIDHTTPDAHRAHCRLHAAKRAEQRDIPLDMSDLERLETMIARMSPAFQRPARNRTWITVRHQGKRRVRVLYDTSLGCIVTVWQGGQTPRPDEVPS